MRRQRLGLGLRKQLANASWSAGNERWQLGERHPICPARSSLRRLSRVTCCGMITCDLTGTSPRSQAIMMRVDMDVRRLIWVLATIIVAPFVALAVYLAYAQWIEQPRLILSSGSPGGIYHEAGIVLAGVLSPSFKITVKESAGAVENAARIQATEAQLGFARDGLPDIGSRVRALARLYRSHFQVVTRLDAHTTDVEGVIGLLRSKQMTAYVGPMRSGTRVVSELVLKQYGVDIGDIDVHGSDLSLNDAAKAMRRGDIGVGFFSVGLGSEALNSLASDGRFSLLNLDRADALVTAFPYFDKTTIPAGAYQASAKFPQLPVTTIASYELLICSTDLSDRRAYQIVSTLFSRSSEVMRAFPLLTQLSQVDPEKNFYYPLHPGAASFYRRSTEPAVLSWQLVVGVITYGITTSTWLLFFLRRRRVAPLLTTLRSLHKMLLTSTSALSVEELHKHRRSLEDVERRAAELFVSEKIKADPYDSVKEYLRVCKAELARHDGSPSAPPHQTPQASS